MATLTAPQQQTLDDLRRYGCQVKREEYDGRRGRHFVHFDAVSSNPRGFFTVRATIAEALIGAGCLVWDAQCGRYVLQEVRP